MCVAATRALPSVTELMFDAFRFVNPDPSPLRVALIVPLTVRFPVNSPLPTTCSASDGVVVPIPTLPPGKMAL